MGLKPGLPGAVPPIYTTSGDTIALNSTVSLFYEGPRGVISLSDTSELGFEPLAGFVHRSATHVESREEHKEAVDSACI